MPQGSILGKEWRNAQDYGFRSKWRLLLLLLLTIPTNVNLEIQFPVAA